MISTKIKLRNLLLKKRALQCERSFFEFLQDSWEIIEPNKKFIATDYIEFQCNLAQEEVEYYIQNGKPKHDVVVINIPPATTKSTLWTKALPAWIWITYPHVRMGNTSHSSGLSKEHSTQTRKIIQSEWYQQNWGDRFSLQVDKNRTDEYGNDKMGYRKSFSIGVGVTGFHMDFLFADDPIDVMQPNITELVLNKANAHVNSFISTRVHGTTFLIMQRASKGDTTDVILNNPELNVYHVCFPIQKTNNVKPSWLKKLYNKNGYLDDRLEKSESLIKSTLTSSQFSAQYDQEPTDTESQIIHESWFTTTNSKSLPTDIKWNVYIDGAYTQSTKNDPTGIMIAGYSTIENKLYIRDFTTVWKSLPKLIEYVEEYYDNHSLTGTSKTLIEPKASGISLRQSLNSKSKIISAIDITSPLVRENKVSRANFSSVRIESGFVVLVEGKWNKAYIDEMSRFPLAKHDEAIDLTAYAIDHAVNGVSSSIYYNGDINSISITTTHDKSLYPIFIPSIIETPYVAGLIVQVEKINNKYVVNVLREFKANNPNDLANLAQTFNEHKRMSVYGILEPKTKKKIIGRRQIFDNYCKLLNAKNNVNILRHPSQYVRDFTNKFLLNENKIAELKIDPSCVNLISELKATISTKGEKNRKAAPNNCIFSDLFDTFVGIYFEKHIKSNT